MLQMICDVHGLKSAVLPYDSNPRGLSSIQYIRGHSYVSVRGIHSCEDETGERNHRIGNTIKPPTKMSVAVVSEAFRPSASENLLKEVEGNINCTSARSLCESGYARSQDADTSTRNTGALKMLQKPSMSGVVALLKNESHIVFDQQARQVYRTASKADTERRRNI